MWSFVPTPSIDETRTGLAGGSALLISKSPPKRPISVRTAGLKVSRTCFLISLTICIPVSILTPASVYFDVAISTIYCVKCQSLNLNIVYQNRVIKKR